MTNKPASANKAGRRACRWSATLNCQVLDATSLPVINRCANPTLGHLSERGIPFRVVRKAAVWMSASPSVAHASHEGLNDRSGAIPEAEVDRRRETVARTRMVASCRQAFVLSSSSGGRIRLRI